MKKLIQLIDKFDGPQSTLSNEEFFIREKLLLYLKLFWVFSIVIFVLLGIIVSISSISFIMPLFYGSLRNC